MKVAPARDAQRNVKVTSSTRGTIFQRRSRVLNLLLSSLIAGTVGTLVILAIYFLLPYYRGVFSELLGALASPFAGRSGGSRFAGTVIFLIGGIVFAALYGWAALELAQVTIPSPVDEAGRGLVPNMPAMILLGMAIGFVHSVPMGFLYLILMTRNEPAEPERNRFLHIPIHMVAHAAYGATVMLLHSLLL
jgi:hypothetical protein